jgi:GrpB-like predicted nucleotidyltransferase (UPF0157 family)
MSASTHAVRSDALGIEHIGSTSVPGLAAKPIVDVLLTVADVGPERKCATTSACGMAVRGCGGS